MRSLLLLTLFSLVIFAANSFEEVSARATAARVANDGPHAIEFYRQALDLNPGWQEGWWFLGTFLYDGDQYAAARDAFRRFTEINPGAAPGWGLLGLCEFQTGEYVRSLADVQRSLALGSGNEPKIGEVLRYHEALLLTRDGDFDQALEKLVPFVGGGEPNPYLLPAFGLAALRRPLVPQQVPAAQQELIAGAGKAAFFMLAHRVKEADQAFHALLENFPSAANVHYLYACYLFQTDQDHAVAELKRELELTPGNPAAAAVLASILLVRGDTAAALGYAEKAAQDEPKSPNAQYVLGRVLLESGNAERGIKYLELAVKLDPANLEDHVALAAAYPKAGRYQDAKRERRQALELSREMDRVAQP